MTPFRLIDAHSAAEAVALLQVHGPRAQVIASGGDLLELWKEGIAGPTLAPPEVVVNLAAAPALAEIALRDDGLHLGSMARLAQLRRFSGAPSMLHEAMDRIASPQLRARTTLGGNLLQRPRCLYFRHPDIQCFKKGGTGCPAVAGPPGAYPGALFPGSCHAGHPSDLAPVLLALDAQARIAGPAGERRTPLAHLYGGAASNTRAESTLAPGEILVAVVVPPWRGAQAFEKVAARSANEFALASAAVVLTERGGCIAEARIAMGGVAPAPMVLAGATELLRGARHRDVPVAQIAVALLENASLARHAADRLPDAKLALERALQRALAEG